MNSRAFRRGAVAVAAFSATAIVLAGLLLQQWRAWRDGPVQAG